jgi:putative FmdB family regulatory protein
MHEDCKLEDGCGFDRGVPVFEYRCLSCKKKFSALVGMVSDVDDSKCPHCGSVETAKLVSRFARYRSEDDRIEELASRIESTGEPDSPREMRTMMREMGKALDEDSSDEMEELFEADMAGELGDED